MKKANKRWSAEEEKYLVDQVMWAPQSLKKCFMAVAKKTGRTEKAVAGHWYTVTSKDPENACFVTISRVHKSVNRKNSVGEPCKESIFTKLLKLIGLK